MHVQRCSLPHVMVVTCGAILPHRSELLPRVIAAVRGGVGMIQVREKDLSDAVLSQWVAGLLAELHGQKLNAHVMINDRPHVARALGLGLHLSETAFHALGGEPRPPHLAASLDNAKTYAPLWGCSVHSAAALRKAAEAAADYAVLGTIFPTASKPGYGGIGVNGLSTLLGRCGSSVEHSIPPIFAIGGMDTRCIAAVIGAGAYGIASSSGILAAEDVEKTAHTFVTRAADAFISAQHLLWP